MEWMQTYLVHMRSPRVLLADLGVWQTIGLQVLLGGMILSALVHPLVYIAAAINIALGNPVFSVASGFWLICWINFAAGHIAGVALGIVAARRSGLDISPLWAFLMPVYWLANSAASYRAIWDFYRRPFYWEKTPHAARPVTPARTTAYSWKSHELGKPNYATTYLRRANRRSPGEHP
jgi:hypothetical protein